MQRKGERVINADIEGSSLDFSTDGIMDESSLKWILYLSGYSFYDYSLFGIVPMILLMLFVSFTVISL